MQVGGAAVDGLVAGLGTPLAAGVLAPIIVGAVYDLNHICPSGDPGDPVLTVVDYVKAWTGADLFDKQGAWDRIQQWFVHMMFPLWCDCADGSSPPPATSAPLPPAGNNTGLPSGTATGPCWDVHIVTAYAAGTTPGVHQLATESYVPGPFVTGMTGGAGITSAAALPPGVTQFTTTASAEFEGSSTTNATVGMFCFNASKAFLNVAGIVTTPSTPFTHTWTLPTGTAYWSVGVLNEPGNSPVDVDIALSFLCSGQQAGQITTPCCPPDPLLDARLTLIIQLEQALIQLVNNNIGSHVDGTRHTGLSGSGSVVLVDSVDAIRVEVTSSLAGWPANPGVPTYFFSLGFITSIAAESPLKGWRLVYGSQTFPIVSYADSIGYTLPPAVTIDIVELLPGP